MRPTLILFYLLMKNKQHTQTNMVTDSITRIIPYTVFTNNYTLKSYVKVTVAYQETRRKKSGVPLSLILLVEWG